jgi:hypothetical protein
MSAGTGSGCRTAVTGVAARGRQAPVLEAIEFGLLYVSGRCWERTCPVASFLARQLTKPYRRGVPVLPTDTAGAIAFVVRRICLTVGEHLRLGRRRGGTPRSESAQVCTATALTPLALAETATVLSSVLFLTSRQPSHSGGDI